MAELSSPSPIMDAPATPKTETNKRTGLTYQQLLRNLFVQLRDGCGHPDCRTPTCFTCRSSCMSPGSRHARKYTSATAKAIAVELISSEDPSRHACPFMPRSPQTVPDARRQENIDPKSLVQQLFNTRAFEKFLQSSNHSDIYHTSPLEDLTQALERHLVETSRLANTNSNASKTRPDVGLTTDLALQAIQALIAFVPRADLDTWKVVWKVVLDTLSDGLAYGKQRFCKAEVDSSLPILDAFESEPALNLATRLMEVVAASDAAQIAPALRMHGDESDLPAVVSTLRQGILSWFIENSSTFWRESGKSKGEETLQRQTPFETTSIIWLEWLRKCFVKSWDGSYRVSRRSVAGVALLLMHDFWTIRHRLEGGLHEDLFLTHVVSNNLRVDKAAKDWLDYRDGSDTQHILSFHFLFDTRTLTSMFRMVNYIRMCRAYCGASAIHKMRSRALARALARPSDRAYLDRRTKVMQEPYLVLKISRHSVLSDAFDQIWHRLQSELAKPLRIRMGVDEGEIGHDLGGVQIEFFKLVCSEALDSNYGLFSIDPETHLAWFQPGSLVPLYKYELFGALVALAIYNGVTLPISFPLCFYRKLLNEKNDYDTLIGRNNEEESALAHDRVEDLREGWPSLYKSLQALREYKGSVEDDFAQDYTFSLLANGLNVEVKMTRPWQTTDTKVGKMTIINAYPDKHHPKEKYSRESHWSEPEPNTKHVPDTDCPSPQAEASQSALPNPIDIEALAWPGWQLEQADPTESVETVTKANSQQYLLDYISWLMDYSIHPQFSSFARGFSAVLDRKALNLLTPSAFRALVEGHSHLNIDLLQQAATYRGYSADSEVILWFWDVVSNYPPSKQKQLLEFVTATSRVPVNGEGSLTFIIEQLPDDDESLPGSSTCFSTLRLPEYESKEILRRKLDVALEHSLGFGQA